MSAPVAKFGARWIAPKALDRGVLEAVDSIRIVDTHEHLDEESVRLTQENNLTKFFMYYSFCDVASGGMTGDEQTLFWKKGVTGEEQWRALRRAWPMAKHTGFCRAITLSIKGLYGIDDLRDDTIKPLLRAIEARNKPGVLNWMLRVKSGIECALVNANDPGDLARRTGTPGLFLFDMAVSDFCNDKLDVRTYERVTGVDCSTLAGWKKMIDWYFRRWGSQVVAIKNVCAYWRVLRFDEVPETKAAALYGKWQGKRKATKQEMKAVQDFMFHYCVQRATDLKLPVKLHAGYHSGNNYMDMSLFQVKDLTNLFQKYHGKFDVFHLSYPEWTDLVALAKHYTNVWPNLCWAWIIDPEASLAFCRQALHALPLNRVLGFGGDYGFADVVYGHGRIARDGIALVLTEAVRQGRLTRADAALAARRWLRDNAMELYRIEEKRAAQAKGQPRPLPSAAISPVKK